MTHLLHAYIAEQLARHLNNHRVVVWYDPRSEFEPFVSELGGKPVGDGLLQVIVGGVTTDVRDPRRLAVFTALAGRAARGRGRTAAGRSVPTGR